MKLKELNVTYYMKTIILLSIEHMLHVAEKLALNFQLINESIGLFVQIWQDYYTCLGQAGV